MKLKLLRIAGVGLMAWVGCGCEPSRPSLAPDAAGGTNQITLPARVEFQKLLGRWERPDGGYVLEIRAVDGSGQLEAGYFNPAPIRVERAAAVLEAGQAKVLVVLRDTGYPGCTYTLSYDAVADQLFGQYFQATQQQTYDVTFARLK